MSIMYKAVPKGQPGVAGGGEIKYYPAIVRERKIDIRAFAEEISERSMIGTTEVFGVLESFMGLMSHHLLTGRTVELGQLGHFTPFLSGNASETADEVKRSSIKKVTVSFRPSTLLARRLANVQFEKVSNGAATVE